MKVKSVAVAFLVLASVVISAMVFTQAGPLTGKQNPAGQLDVSWAQWYGNTSAMAKSVDIIAVGKVTGINKTIGGGLPLTDFNVKVLSLIKPASLQVTILTVRQTGINQSGKVFEVADDPLFRINQTYVFFLFQARNSQGAILPSLYYVAAGPEGRFLVNGTGLVYSLDVVYPTQIQETLPTRVDGQPLGIFLSGVKSDFGGV